jgi:hypothetical protein
VTEKGIYTDDNCCIEEIDLVAKGVKVNEEIGFVPKSEIMLKSGECGADDDEESDWTNNRMCFAKIMVARGYCKSDCCTHNWWYNVSAWSESWGRLIVEYRYKSFHYCEGLEIQMPVPIVDSWNGQITTFHYDNSFIFNTDISYPSSDEYTHFWWKNKEIGHVVKIWSPSTVPPDPIPTPNMTKVKGSFSTRGTHPVSAVIDCGYGH